MKNITFEQHNSSIFNLDAVTISIGTLLFSEMIILFIEFPFISILLPLIVFILEKNSNTVKFITIQYALMQIFLNILGFISSLLATQPTRILENWVMFQSVIVFIFFVLLIYTIFNAIRYKETHYLIFGKIAEVLVDLSI